MRKEEEEKREAYLMYEMGLDGEMSRRISAVTDDVAVVGAVVGAVAVVDVVAEVNDGYRIRSDQFDGAY